MKFVTAAARRLPCALLTTAIAVFLAVLALTAWPARASVGPRSSGPPSSSNPPATTSGPAGFLAEVELGRTIVISELSGPPRCTLQVTQKSYREGETVRASLHLSNPKPHSTEVEMKLWLSAPGEAPLSVADPIEAGRPLELPGMLNRNSGKLRLFSVDAATPRGMYEMSCRLIDPVTGSLVSEDLNAFQVK